jgi:hypothetical protein
VLAAVPFAHSLKRTVSSSERGRQYSQ